MPIPALQARALKIDPKARYARYNLALPPLAAGADPPDLLLGSLSAAFLSLSTPSEG